MTKRNILSITAFSTVLPAAALAAVVVGDTLGTTEAEIRAKLEAEGYTVTEIERENDEFEVEVLIDGVEHEIEVAALTGEILEFEAEDDDEDDD